MTHDVFISHSSRDKAVADAVCATLEGRKIRCWIAPRDVPPGQPWAGAIVDAIGQSRACVLVLSDGSNRSDQVAREVGEAVDRGVPIVPFRVEDIEPTRDLRYYIKSIHWLDALTPPLERHLEILANSVQALLTAGDREPAGVVASSEPEMTREVTQEGPADRRPVAPEWKPGELQVLGHHGSAVDVVAVSPDGSRAVTGSSDRTLKVWDLKRGAELLTLTGHSDDLKYLAVTRDGKQVYSASADGIVMQWSLYTGSQMEIFEVQARLRAPFLAVAVAPDGQRALAVVTDSRRGGYATWDLDRGRGMQLASSRSKYPIVTVTPDGQRMALAGTGAKIAGRPMPQAAWITTMDHPPQWFPLAGHTDTVSTLALTPDGKRAVAGAEDSTLMVWDLLSDEEPVNTRKRAKAVYVTPVCTLHGHTEAVTTVAVTPDGQRAVSGSRDGTIRLWDLSSREMVAMCDVSRPVRCVALAQGEKGVRLVAGDAGGRVLLLDLEEQQPDHQVRQAAVPDSTTPEALKDRGLKAPAAEILASAEARAPATEVQTASDKPETRASGTEEVKDRIVMPSPPLPKAAITPPVSPGPGVDRAIATPPICSREEPFEELVRLGHGMISTVSLSPDGAMLAVASSLGIWIYGVDGFEPLRLLGGGHRAPSLAWSPDCRRLASGEHAGVIRVWDADSGEMLMAMEGHPKSVSALAWSPDGTRLLSGGHDGTFRVWDAHSGSGILMRETGIPCTGVAWSPDSTNAAIVVSRVVHLWDLDKGESRLALDHRHGVSDIAWSPDGTQLASATVQCVSTWDAASGEEQLTLKGHIKWVKSVAWSADGGALASGGDDGTVRVWSSASGRRLQVLKGHRGAVKYVTWLPCGTKLVSVGFDETVRLWDAADGHEQPVLEGHTGSLQCIAWSEDGASLASGDGHGVVYVWGTDTWKLVHRLGAHRAGVASVAFSPDGTRLVSAGWREVWLWDAVSGWKLREFRGHTNDMLHVAWSPDGARLASGGKDGTIRVWDTAPGGGLICTLKGHTSWVQHIGWSQDGTLLSSKAGGGDRSIRVWDATRGDELEPRRLSKVYADCVAWSPDRTRVALGLSSDPPVRVVNATDGAEMISMAGGGAVASLAWSFDGTIIASGGRDGAVRMWDTVTGEQLCVLEGHLAAVSGLAWAPDGKRLASASSDGTVRVWGAHGERSI